MKFRDYINGEKPVLVDFHAEWCGPCKAMAPIIKQVKDHVKGKAYVLKVDIDKNPKLARKLKIQGVPTFAIYKKGKIVWRQSGMQSLNTLIQKIEEYA